MGWEKWVGAPKNVEGGVVGRGFGGEGGRYRKEDLKDLRESETSKNKIEKRKRTPLEQRYRRSKAMQVRTKAIFFNLLLFFGLEKITKKGR